MAAVAGSGQDARDMRRYAVYVTRVLSDTVVKGLQALVLAGDTRPVVVGARALDAYVGAPYRTGASVWHVDAHGNAQRGVDPREAARIVSLALARGLAETARRQALRMGVIDDHFGTRLEGVGIVPSDGGEGWRVVVTTSRWPPIDAVVVRPAYGPARGVVVFDAVAFLGPTFLLSDLRAVAAAAGAPPAARAGAAALLADAEWSARDVGLAANLYRHLLVAPDPAVRARAVAAGLLDPERGVTARSAMRRRVAAIAMGPPDASLPPHGVPAWPSRPRLRISEADVRAHDAYFRSLPPAMRAALDAYTGPLSGAINMALLDRFFGSGAQSGTSEPLALASLIQRALLDAPPLGREAVVYKVARFLYFGGDAAAPAALPCPGVPGTCPAAAALAEEGAGALTNYGLRAGDLDRQWVFNSTTYDPWIDFGPFLDEFAPCCAFVIRVPSGSRGVLIIDRNSSVPNEREVLLPYGCAFRVMRRRPDGEVTFRGTAETGRVFYQDTVVYEVEYVAPPELADGVDGASAEVPIATSTRAHAARTMAAGTPWAADLTSLRTPAHVEAVGAHPDLMAFLVHLLHAQLAGGFALPRIGGA